MQPISNNEGAEIFISIEFAVRQKFFPGLMLKIKSLRPWELPYTYILDMLVYSVKFSNSQKQVGIDLNYIYDDSVFFRVLLRIFMILFCYPEDNRLIDDFGKISLAIVKFTSSQTSLFRIRTKTRGPRPGRILNPHTASKAFKSI